jgi:hypothetical protein
MPVCSGRTLARATFTRLGLQHVATTPATHPHPSPQVAKVLAMTVTVIFSCCRPERQDTSERLTFPLSLFVQQPTICVIYRLPLELKFTFRSHVTNRKNISPYVRRADAGPPAAAPPHSPSLPISGVSVLLARPCLSHQEVVLLWLYLPSLSLKKLFSFSYTHCVAGLNLPAAESY